MTRWQKLQTLFEQALERPAADRFAFLEAACDDDPALLEEVVALLDADDSANGTLAGAAAGSLDDDFDAEFDSQLAGSELGPYRLLRRIGVGGMGTVFLGERADGAFERQVAVKVMRRGMDSARVVQRFEDERRILSRLDHPNIASLLDGGVMPDGRPYFVMEYVDGLPITEHCDERRLSIAERLRLFEVVCRAVHHAHRNLVVHRDLKPRNILVNTEGQVKLLDFGIAKLLDEGAGEKTRTGSQLLTPAYAAPEQLLNLDITTATDVYGLGVVLYELLTGRRPFEAMKTPTELREQVLSGNAPRPSTIITRTAPATGEDGVSGPATLEQLSQTRSIGAGRLRQLIRGDLDTICLMAIRPEPGERYASAEQLAEDIERHLTGVPVRARQGNLGYRARKFVRRNRAGVAASVLAAAGFVAFGAYHVNRLAEERDTALLQQQKADEVVRFVTGLFVEADPSNARGEDVTARQLLEAGRRQIDNELIDQPELRGTMKNVLGEVYYTLGEESQAETLLEEARGELEQALGAAHPDTITARFNLGHIAQNRGDYDAAEAAFMGALEARRAAYGANHEEVLSAVAAMAFLEETRGNFDAAEAYHLEALDIAAALYPGDDVGRAEQVYNLAGFYRTQDRREEAEPMLREVLAILDRLYDGRHPLTAKAKRQLAGLMRNSDRFSDAEPLYAEVIALQEELLGPDHYELAVTWNSYSQLLLRTGRQEEALDANANFVGIIERGWDMHPSLGAAYNNRAFMLSEAGYQEEALENFDKSLAMQDAVNLPPRHLNRTFPTAGKAQVFQKLDRHAEAAPLLREMLAIRREALDEDHRLVSELKSDLGGSLLELDELDEAEALLIDAHERFAAKELPGAQRLVETRERLVILYERTGRPEQAVDMRALIDTAGD